MPVTTATYTIVTNAARTPNTTVFLTTTSRSYRRYLRMAIPEARGIPRARMNVMPNQNVLPRNWAKASLWVARATGTKRRMSNGRRRAAAPM